MNEVEFLQWVKGSAFNIAMFIFVAGLLLRLFEILSLGYKHNFAVAKGNPMKGGLRELWRRSIPAARERDPPRNSQPAIRGSARGTN